MMKTAMCNDTVIADSVSVADTYFKRLRGLLGREQLRKGEGLLLTNVSMVHCFFMRFTIDVVYLSDEMIVQGIETLKPWHLGKKFENTKHTLELEENKAHELLKTGDMLRFEVTD